MDNGGYSKTPLAKKLGIKENTRILGYQLPTDYITKLQPLPEGVITTDIPQESAFIHLFVRQQSELAEALLTYVPLLSKKGMIWVSWPKGSSGVKTDLKRDFIRAEVLKTGLVDIKVASFDQRWSGLKFVYRVKHR
jgi:hypothetical protein